MSKNNDSPDNISQIILEASHLAAKAFLKTPSFKQIYRIKDDDVLFEQRLQSLFWKNINMIYENYPSALHYHYETDENGKSQMVCFFMLYPGKVTMTLWQKIRYGLILLPFEIGWQPFIRLLAASDYFDQKIEGMLNGREGFQVDRVVVHPAYQGKGIGSRVLRKALTEVADSYQLPAVLVTHDPRNVIFYSRL